MNKAHHDLTRTISVVAAWLALCVCVPGAAYASNLSFLQNSPTANLSPEDRRLLREAASSLLETGTAGATRQWENPQSGAGGLVTLVRAFTSSEGFACRTLRFESHAGGWQGNFSAPVCEVKSGDWKLYADAKPAALPPGEPPAAKSP